MRKPRNYSLKLTPQALKLYISGILHLSIKRKELVGVQSWELDGVYCIEYTTHNNSILTEYNKADKWKAVLSLLDADDIYV